MYKRLLEFTRNYRIILEFTGSDQLNIFFCPEEELDAPLSIEKIFELARACIDFMYKLHDFFWEEFSQYKDVFVAHISAFWSFFLVDMREAIAHSRNMVLQLQLFHVVNNYFSSQRM